MELTKQQLLYRKQTADALFHINESGDSIIPDSLSDAQRIIDAYPIFMIREKQPRQDAFSIKLNILINVLYLAEDGNSICSVSIPLGVTVSDTVSGITPTSELMCMFSDCLAQARLLNSRKISVTASCQMRLNSYDSVRELLTTDVAGDNSDSCECLWHEFDSVETTCAITRNFSVSDEISFPISADRCGTLLRTKATISANEIKVVNNKVVMKGEVKLDALMSTTDNKIEPVSTSVPFTQISDVSDVSDRSQPNVQFTLRNMEIEPLGDSSQNNGCRYLISMGICADIIQTDTVKRKVLSDIYSTSDNLSCERKDYSYSTSQLGNEITVSVNEVMELGTNVSNVITADIAVCDTVELNDDETSIPVTCTVMYTDDSLQPQSASRRLYGKISEQGSGNYRIIWTQPRVQIGSDGSLPITFELRLVPITHKSVTVSQIDEVKIDGKLPEVSDNGVLLRRIRKNDTLWDIGKEYRVPIETIREINKTQDLPSDRTMLVIPVGRV